MRKINRFGKRLCAIGLSLVMVLSSAIDNMGTIKMVRAAEAIDGFVEVAVPNGNFEGGATSWTFTGNGTSNAESTYWRVFDCTSPTNESKVYETCNKSGVNETYTCYQTVKGLTNGVYYASIDAQGGNDGGYNNTTFTAGGESVAVTPNQWNNWITYSTAIFEVTNGTCQITISSTVRDEYVNMDNVKLYRLNVDTSDKNNFVEAGIPNGDFEAGATTWTFTGNGTSDAESTYWRVFDCTSTSNKTKVYETCNKSGVEETYTCSQTVTGLTNGVYYASVEAMGGNDPGNHTTTFTAGGESVALTPNEWNNWITYSTDIFVVTDGTCQVTISSTVRNEYINIDNVKLHRLNDGLGKEVQSVLPVSAKVKTGGTFTAPTKATVLFTDGTSTNVDVAWNQTELSRVVTTAAASFTVSGKVTVNDQEYNVTMTVTVLDSADSIQTIPEGSQGSIDFDSGWQFYLATRTPEVNGNFATGGVKDAGNYSTNEIISTSFDDTSWRTVDVPHDFSIEGQKTTASNDSQGYLQGGLAYYRKTFEVPQSLNNKNIIIDFEGVYQNAVVYLNGREIGNYPSGYTGFAFDITDYIVFGGINVLVVKVQNMSPSGRWYTGSGIIRPVHLMVENSARFSRNGITFTTPTLESDLKNYNAAYLTIDAKGQTEDSNSNVYMEVAVFDANGNQVAKNQTEKVALNAGTFNIKLKDMEISNPHLWYPWNIGTPYLYTVKTSLYQEKNGTDTGYLLVDQEEFEYGFRYFKVAETTKDVNSGGLYVNGVYTKVQGVDLHHDSGALGAASYTDAYERQFDKLTDMGVNAYRTSHCPPSKQIIEVCRRKGILVFEEAFDGWGAAKASYDFGQFFLRDVPNNWVGLKPNGFVSVPTPAVNYSGAKYTWSDWVIQEMVQRDKNEPSVLAWSIGNEVRGAGSLPSWYKSSEYDILHSGSTNSTYTEAVRLAQAVRAQDSTRLVITGTDNERSVPSASAEYGLVNQVLDGLGLNYNTAKSVDQLINRFSIGDGTLYATASKTFFFESESSSQTSSRGVYLDPQFSNTGINQTPGSRGGSNYDNDFASWTMSNEYGLKKDRDRKSFIGQFIWTGFDYIGEPTPYSVYPVGVASFGTMDTAGFPKDSYYLYKSQWIKGEDEPMVHLLPTDWDSWHEGEKVTVWVNTNMQTAELFLNGKSLGKKSFDEKVTAYGKKYYETSESTSDDKTWGDGSNPGGYTSTGAVLDSGETNYGKLHLTWEVPYQPGTLEVVAYDENGDEAAKDSVTTSDIPYTIDTEVSKSVLAADGSSLSYVECTVVDENGNMVANADDLVKFDVTGPVTIVGVDNGQQESTELYKWGNVDKNTHSQRRAYNGKVLVILKSERTVGDAVLTVSADNLKPAQVNIKVTEDGSSNETVSQSEVNGTVTSIDPVEITVPEGMDVELPKTVKVNYTSSAGTYSVFRPVEWAETSGDVIQGTVSGVTTKATATIKKSASAKVNVELATNTALGSGNATFRFADLNNGSQAAGNALATATFTGSTSNYPNNMLDGNTNTSWTNAYSRGSTALLPENSASRASDCVDLYWNEKKVLNQISLSFVQGKTTAIPKSLEVQYWDGGKWIPVNDQTTYFATATKLPTVMQFTPVYTERVRIYMVNGTPFTSSGNIEIVEASAKLVSEEYGAKIVMESNKSKISSGEKFTVTGRFENLPNTGSLLRSVSFVVDYDDRFDEPTLSLVGGVSGTLSSTNNGNTKVWTYTNQNGIPSNIGDFITATFVAGGNVVAGNYKIRLSSLTGENTSGQSVNIGTTVATVSMSDTEIYLSNLDWISATSGWESVNKDLNCNGADSSAIALKVDGQKQEFDKGLGVCADSEIIYDISSYDVERFQAWIGIDYFKLERGEYGDGVKFLVYGDGVLLYESVTLDTNSNAVFVDIPLENVDTLRLVVDKLSTNIHDNADWANAKLILAKEKEPVAKIGKVEYHSFEDALEAAVEGDRIKLLADITDNDIIKIEKSIIIDGSGCTVTGTGNKVFEVYEDTVFENIKVVNESDGGCCVDTKASIELELSNVEFIAEGSASKALTVSGSYDGTNVTIKDSLINGGSTGDAVVVYVQSNIIINNTDISGLEAVVVKAGSEGTVVNVVNGSMLSSENTLTGSMGTIAVETTGVTVNVEDSTIKATKTGNANQALFALKGADDVVINVDADTVFETNNRYINDYKEGQRIVVPTAYKNALENEGYLIIDNGDGTCHIAVITAEVDGVGYETIEEAINVAEAATEEKTVVLVSDALEQKNIVISGDITIDLNGHSLGADYVVLFATANMIDSSEENTGLLIVPKNKVVFDKNNEQLPIWNGVNGYIFVEVLRIQQMTRIADGMKQYIFLPTFEEVAHSYLLNGSETSGVTIASNISWKRDNGTNDLNYVFADNLVSAVISSYNSETSVYGYAYMVHVSDSVDLTEKKYNAIVRTQSGVEISTTGIEF